MRKLTDFLVRHSIAVFIIGGIWIAVLAIHHLVAWDEPFGTRLVKLLILLPFCLPVYIAGRSDRNPRFFIGRSRHRPNSGIEVTYGTYFVSSFIFALVLTLASLSKSGSFEIIAIIDIFWTITSCPEQKG